MMTIKTDTGCHATIANNDNHFDPPATGFLRSTRFLRGPLVWSVGVSCLLVLHAGVLTHHYEHHLALAFSLLGFTLVTVWCSILFWLDVIQYAVEVILRPVAIAAMNVSLDDVLKIVCDPTHLATWISGMIMVPVTLYALPTTPEERAQVLQSAGILPDDATNVLTRAGGWRVLLPEKLQRFLRIVLNDPQQSFVVDSSETDPGSSAGSEGSNEDESEEYFPYSVSPVYQTTSHTPPTFEQEENNNECTLDPHELLAKIVWNLTKSKLENLSESLSQHKTSAAITALTATTLLVAQLRHSQTARTSIKTLLHLLATTGSSTVLVGSLATLLGPQLHNNSTSIQYWYTSMFARLHSVPAKIPRSYFTPKFHDKLKTYGKGILAALVLVYFRYRRQQRVHQGT